jgi:sigma-B regulation protein RsbU (phosphoserine phosphatase)
MANRTSSNSKGWWKRPILFALAVVFALATVLYTTLWLVSNRSVPDVELGFGNSPTQVVTRIEPNSPAEKAGLRLGDRILAIDRTPFESSKSLYGIYKAYKPGDTVQLTIERPGQTSRIVLTATFRRHFPQPGAAGRAGAIAELLRNSYPVPFVVVGLSVLFLHFENPRVWHLALLFASFAPGPGGIEFAAIPAALLPFAIAYQVVFQGALAPLFYWFFAEFPVRSPLDRRFPWLKWASLISIPIGTLSQPLPGLRVAGLRLSPLANVFGAKSQMEAVFVACIMSFVALGLVSLASNFFGTTDPEARRKIRVIFWGTTIAFAPILIIATSHFFVEYQDPAWLDIAVILIASLFPLSFVYAVLKHRVLGIPLLLKRSARYLFVKQGFVLITALAINLVLLLFLVILSRIYRVRFDSTLVVGVAAGVILGAIAARANLYIVRRITDKIDRAFFRSAYNAGVILQELAEKTRTVSGREELARLLETEVAEALHPKSLACYLDRGDGNLVRERRPPAGERGKIPAALPRPNFPVPFGATFHPRELDSIPATLPLLTDLGQRGKTWEVPQSFDSAAQGPLAPDCLVPILGRDSRLIGLLVLGQRLSEEPYSSEDKHLLESVASQAGVALETMELAEKMAERMEAELRAAREMEIARDVQSRLLPQELPRLATLDLAARCVEARAVGGDYYDFLDLGPNRVGFLLADVSGKGVHAALLMANLQAYLRSQSGIAPFDLVRLMQQANRMLLKVTASEHFATLFFATYDDVSREMTYVNCGHNAPVWLRRDGSVQRLPATATMLGAFENWDCEVGEICLAPGDVLVIFSDGVTEAARQEEEYGEERLIRELNACRNLPVGEMVEAIFSSVQAFSPNTQSDDFTLVIAKVRC